MGLISLNLQEILKKVDEIDRERKDQKGLSNEHNTMHDKIYSNIYKYLFSEKNENCMFVSITEVKNKAKIRPFGYFSLPYQPLFQYS